MNTESFFRYAIARHQIYLRRLAGEPKPWTKDPILQTYRFTNVYRELDKTTLWFKKHVRDKYRAEPEALLATVIFRWFNRIESGEAIFCQPDLFDGETAFERILAGQKVDAIKRALIKYCGDGPYVTGAYMIKSPTGLSKLDGMCQVIDYFRKQKRSWQGRQADWREVAFDLQHNNFPQQDVWSWLREYENQGPFLAYEVVTDLRHTTLLYDAPDIMTWANPGPGAMRGLSRMNKMGYYQTKKGITRPNKFSKEEALPMMREILEESHNPSVIPAEWPKWEMREVEHTLCEWDKYERARLGHGRPRGVYA